jgi:hypothetical protein
VRCLLLFALAAACPLRIALATPPPAPAAAPPLVIFDGPVWDPADEGLPYRITFAWLARPDPLARLLRVRESRWTLGAGYAVAYDNLDTGTNTITARGRDGVMFNAGRQVVWPVPVRLPRGELGLEFELGLNYAARRLPSNGSHLSFSLITGFEWSHAPERAGGWLAGVRWLHLSHGGFFGANGGYDGVVFRLGRQWKF